MCWLKKLLERFYSTARIITKFGLYSVQQNPYSGFSDHALNVLSGCMTISILMPTQLATDLTEVEWNYGEATHLIGEVGDRYVDEFSRMFLNLFLISFQGRTMRVPLTFGAYATSLSTGSA